MNMEYPEELFEMASVRSRDSDAYYDRLLAVNPDINRNGAYFKYYKSNTYGNKSGNMVARINFFKPELINHKEKNGIPNWSNISSSDKDRLIDILKSPSDENPNYTVWTVLKYHWNNEKAFRGSLDEYVNGNMDKKYININTRGSYVPYALEIPDYKDLP